MDDQCTSNNTSILCILLKLLEIKAYLSENVLDTFINPKIYFNAKNVVLRWRITATKEINL